MTSEKLPSIRKIIHIDMDAFFASVEQRDNPDYRGKPLVVGGSPDQRGVVAAASYEARKFGIFSAMPARTAIQRCPQLIFAKPRFEVYRHVSEQIREIFYRYTDLVEPLSLDEAYLDVTMNKREMPSATLIAREIKKAIRDELNLTASAGVSINKFLAKTASAVNKPDGLHLIPPDQAVAFIEKLPIEKFYGIGQVTAEKMRQAGVFNGADLKTWSEVDLVRKFGKVGHFYFNIARGCDDRPVVPNRIRKSIGAEESFAHDLSDRHSFLTAIEEIAATLQRRVEKSETSGRTLTLKVKYGDYQQVTRSRTFAESIDVRDFSPIIKIAMELLDTTEVVEKNARLLGLSLSNLDCERESEDGNYVQLTLELK
ncbi:MAG: polymerase [Cyanobacteriota bacterium erpe_2018_sw_21hr_WHONDRS-SW48-000092_B_bin.40]|nr:polymerase [Cyanobacteriota bacterium erpe_2018_sw_21hr_WHONDRS-SW48-000092_B_bin.40]